MSIGLIYFLVDRVRGEVGMYVRGVCVCGATVSNPRICVLIYTKNVFRRTHIRTYKYVHMYLQIRQVESLQLVVLPRLFPGLL